MNSSNIFFFKIIFTVGVVCIPFLIIILIMIYRDLVKNVEHSNKTQLRYDEENNKDMKIQKLSDIENTGAKNATNNSVNIENNSNDITDIESKFKSNTTKEEIFQNMTIPNSVFKRAHTTIMEKNISMDLSNDTDKEAEQDKEIYPRDETPKYTEIDPQQYMLTLKKNVFNRGKENIKDLFRFIYEYPSKKISQAFQYLRDLLFWPDYFPFHMPLR